MADHIAPNVKFDALNRAWRTLYTAFGADALLLIGVGLLELLNTVEVTAQAFWIGLGVLVVKSVLTALGSYLLRLKKAPAEPPAQPTELPAERDDITGL
jgi:uncharacterized membrane protein SirB2